MKINLKDIEKKIRPQKESPKLEEIFDKNIYNRKPLISIRGLKQDYGTRKKPKLIYQNVNIDILEGETLAILGKNGSGKTTLVESISGIVDPTDGDISFHYNFGSKHSNYEKIGFQFQDLSFPSGITIKDILKFTIEMSQNSLPESEVYEMIETFNMKDFLDLQAKKLSGGQQQRLNVMLAMLSKPKVLFLDEFTTGLDIDVKNNIRNFIIKFSKRHNIVIVIVSHDVDIINDMTDRIVIIAEQKIIADVYRETIEKRFGSISDFLKKYIV